MLARRLNRSARAVHPLLPHLFMLTDEARLGDPVAAAALLPRGAGVIFRHYDAADRAALAANLARLCRARGLTLLVAGDAALARAVGADGIHLPEHLLPRARFLRHRYPSFLITAAVHNLRALKSAEQHAADAVLLAPVFATASHPGAAPLGAARLAALLRNTRLPVYALGGISEKGARRLIGSGAAGLAAIGALFP